MRIGRRVRTASRSVGQDYSLGDGIQQFEEEPLDSVGSDVLGGINFDIPGRNIDASEFQNMVGFEAREGRLTTEFGVSSDIAPVKPNSNRVLGLFNVNRFSGSLDTFRFDKAKVYRIVSSAWVEVTGAGLSGGDYDRFDVVFVEDRLFFNNNGLNVLQEINLGANTYAAAGNARKYKYYTVANNRIIGANLIGAPNDPTEIAGSGDRNYAQWDPATDISAFRNSLVEPQNRSIDDITGLRSVEGSLLILRSRSLWLGISQPVASTPFQFIKIVPGIGCNAPYSVQTVRGGVIWYDPFLSNVFYYDAASRSVVAIGDKIRKTILLYTSDPKYVFSSFDTQYNKYELCFEIPGSNTAQIFRYNLDNKQWTRHEVSKGCTLTNSVDFVPTVTIDGLGSTPINSLVGTIDNLSTLALQAKKIFGLNTGERITLSNQFSSAGSLTTKQFEIPGYNQYVDNIEITLKAPITSTTLAVSLTTDQRAVVLKNLTISNPYIHTVKVPVNRICRDATFTLAFFGGGYIEVYGYKVNRYRAERV